MEKNTYAIFAMINEYPSSAMEGTNSIGVDMELRNFAALLDS